jgi:D-alanyl-D-alanine carboxypeptidase
VRTSPLIVPSRDRRRKPGRQRWRWRAAGIAALALALIAVLVVTMAHSKSHGRRSSARSPAVRHTENPPRPSALAAPTLSASGLALGRPPLVLGMNASPQQEPVRLAFHAPPRAGLLFNLRTGRVLWQRNPIARLRIASLNKMMTALVTVKSAPPHARVLVTKQAVDSPGSKVGVLPLGRRVPVESMLYGLLLPSGNDAADALAQHIAGSVRRFVARMNAEAAKLGLGCTRYSSPSGYLDEGNFSCAADLAVLAHVDLEQPRLARIAGTLSAALPFPIKGGRLYLYNNNPLLIYHYPGVTGLKTGYTLASGRCLVATAERRGVRLGVVLLHSPDPATQARQLLDRGFEGVYHLAPVPEPPIPPGA